jgi:hypothetical protein
MHKTVAAKPLNPAAFVVHQDQQILTHRFDVSTQSLELRTVLPIAGKQNHAACQRMRQSAAIGIGQLGACDIQDQRSVCV